MGKVLDKIFRTEYYNAVLSDFSEAQSLYSKGLSAFEKKYQMACDQYEYQKFIHENIETIREYDKTIVAVDSIMQAFPIGVKEFFNESGIKPGDWVIETYRLILAHQNEIKEYDQILSSFQKLNTRHKEAVKLIIGPSPTYEAIKILVTINSNQVLKVDRYYQKYLRLKNRYPSAVTAFIPGTPTLKNITEFGETARESVMQTVEEYLLAKKCYISKSFKSLIGELTAPEGTDYSAAALSVMKKILSLHNERQKKIAEERHIKEITSKYSKPIALRLGKMPSKLKSDEKKELLNIEDELADVQKRYFDIDQQEFNLNGISYLDVLVKQAEGGITIELPKNPKDLHYSARFYQSINETVKTNLNILYSDIPQVDDISPSACTYRKRLLSVITSQYGKAHNGFSFKMTSTRDSTLRELFRFSGYGKDKKVIFDESFSIKDSYNLELSIEGYNATFEDCYNYINDNYDAVNQYNKLKTSQETWYIDALVKIAKKDKALFDYVEGKNREREIRDNARDIIRSYTLGFTKYKQSNLYNFDINTASVTTLQRIIDDKTDIMHLHTIAKAEELLKHYPDAVSEKLGSISTYGGLSYETAMRIYSLEPTLKVVQKRYDEKKEFIRRMRQATQNWYSVAGIPLYFFYWYYPTRFTEISPESQRARRIVYNFKDGKDHSIVSELIQSKLRSTFTIADIRTFTFVCIPASTVSMNNARYSSFSNEICTALGMNNAFSHIHITKEKIASHLGGSDSAEYSFDRSFFKDTKVVLFDDIVTRGSSMSYFKNTLEGLGATVICAMTIGRTYSDWNGHAPEPHPLSGIL